MIKSLMTAARLNKRFIVTDELEMEGNLRTEKVYVCGQKCSSKE